MSHVRAQIRAALRDLLADVPPKFGGTIWLSRVAPLAPDQLPAINIGLADESREELTIDRPAMTECDLRVDIELIATAQDGVDDVLDALLADVESALSSDVTLGGLTTGLMVQSVAAPELAESGNGLVASMTATLAATYHIMSNAPETAI